MQGIYYTKFLRVASDLRQLKAQVLREGAKGGEVGVIAPFCAVCVWETDAQSGEGRGVGGRGRQKRCVLASDRKDVRRSGCITPVFRIFHIGAALRTGIISRACGIFNLWAERKKLKVM